MAEALCQSPDAARGALADCSARAMSRCHCSNSLARSNTSIRPALAAVSLAVLHFFHGAKRAKAEQAEQHLHRYAGVDIGKLTAIIETHEGDEARQRLADRSIGERGGADPAHRGGPPRHQPTRRR